MFRADDNMKHLYVLPSIWFNPLCFHICRSAASKLIRLRNIEPIMKELLLRDPLSEPNPVPPLTTAAPPLPPQPPLVLCVMSSLPDPLGDSSYLMWVWVSSARLLLRAGQCRLLMLFLLKENWGPGGLWVLAVGLSDWKCSTMYFFGSVAAAQADFVMFPFGSQWFLACIISAS